MTEEKIRKKEQIRLFNKETGEINESILSLDYMWNIIESFGIKRESLDPRNNLDYDTVHDLYLTIKKHNSSC